MRAAIGAAVLLASLACQQRSVLLVEELSTGGGANGGAADGGRDRFMFGIAGSSGGGTGGISGSGGGNTGGGFAGAGGVGDGGLIPGCMPRQELCNGTDEDCDGVADNGFDLMRDTANCGRCGNVCNTPHALSACSMGTCAVQECLPGYVDVDQRMDNGCECQRTNGGVEVCDGADNDCDGLVDEDFNMKTDVRHCGGCFQHCQYANAGAMCDQGTCKMAACAMGWMDLNKDAKDGCEYQCTPSNNSVEICDSKDNDCNGMIDDAPTDEGMACGPSGGECKSGTMKCFAGQLACVGAIQPRTEVCDGADNDCDGMIDETDPNVGTDCYPAGTSGCNVLTKTCQGACALGTWSCTGGKLTCGDAKTPQLETCDDLDNDCDGMVDEDFDKNTDPRFCGSCSNACNYSNAVAVCTAGSCSMGACRAGYVNADQNAATGCEYQCTPDGPEVCDGKDNDCDKLVDAADPSLLHPTTNFCLQLGECGKGPGGSTRYPGQASFPVCTTPAGATKPDWVCNYPSSVQTAGINQIVGQESWCDNLDNDCDGAVDEHVTSVTLGSDCFDPNEVGACRRIGKMRCDPADRTAAPRCDYTGVPAATAQHEVCDGLDNDCDGLVDESWDNPSGQNLTRCPSNEECRGVRDDLVHVSAASPAYYIYRHEASRADATGVSAGALEARACSRGSVLPWASLSWTKAKSACEAAGMRLCRVTRSGAACTNGTLQTDEWGFACQLGLTCSNGYYPYACTYDAQRCNGAERNVGAAVATGAQTQCTTTGDLDTQTAGTQSLLDMSGNVAEWTDDCRGTLGDGRKIYTVRGGAFDSFDTALRCDFMIAQLAQDFAHPDTGFRCCSTCPPGQAECGGSCVNLAQSNSHCGACGNACGGGATCRNGVCR